MKKLLAEEGTLNG